MVKTPVNHSAEKPVMPPVPWRLHTMLAVTFLFIILALCYGFYTGNKLIAKHTPLVDAAMEIRLQATTGHLWFEEIISGDKDEDFEVVWHALDNAQWYALAMLKGGKNPEGNFTPLTDLALRREVQEVYGKLIHFRKIAEQRVEKINKAGIGSQLDQEYHAVFDDFTNQADRVETELQKMIARELTNFRLTQLFLIIASLLSAVWLGTIIFRYERRQALDTQTIRETKAEIEKNEKWLATTMASIGDGLICTDTTGKVIYLNKVAADLTGWSLVEAEGKDVLEIFNIVNEETGKLVENPVNKVLKEKRIVALANHTVLISRSGTRYPITDSGAPIIDDRGKLLGAVLVFHDVSAARLSEKKLSAGEKKYRVLLESTSTVPWTLDLDSHKFTYMGRQMEDLLGYPKESWIDFNSWEERLHPEDREWVATTCINATNAGEDHDMEYRMIAQNGRTVWLRDSVAVVKKNGVPKTLVGFMFDLTRRKETEQALEDAQQNLEKKIAERTSELNQTHRQLLHAEKLSAVGRLAASIAHEFNNPLYGVRNVLSGLEKRGNLDPANLEMTEMALEECDRMKTLIANLQDFNRPTSGAKEEMDLHQAIDSMLLLSKKKFKNQKIKIEKEYADDLPQINAVKDQIKQVILNLLTNAADSYKDGGAITVSTEHKDHSAIIQIKDSGGGIPPEDMKHIFEPFFTTKAAVKGTGLGLAVSYGIIKSHGGDITVISGSGCGSIFTVTLPIKA